MAGVLEGVLESQILLANGRLGRGMAREVDWGDRWWFGGCDRGLLRWRAVERVLKDA